MRWFGKRQKPPQPLFDDRHAGKPLLGLLEYYVLDCIGHLPAETSEAVGVTVRRVFGEGEDWKATLRSTLHLEAELDEETRRKWLDMQSIAGVFGEVVTPDDFAKMVVKTNFAALIE